MVSNERHRAEWIVPYVVDLFQNRSTLILIIIFEYAVYVYLYVYLLKKE